MSTLLNVRQNVPPFEKAVAKSEIRLTGTVDKAQQAFGAEQYRVLRHLMEQFGKVGRSVVAISSPVAGDGKTMTSINLAKAMAQAPDSRILLVDADLRRGSVGEQLGLGRASQGLSGAIADPSCRLATAVRRLPALNLSVVLAGPCPAMPYEALRSPRLGELLAEARVSYDCVIVDTPPIVPVADMRALSQWVDGFILVVSAHRTPRSFVDEAPLRHGSRESSGPRL